MDHCIMHDRDEALGKVTTHLPLDLDPEATLYICRDCLPRAGTAFADLKAQIEMGLLDPEDEANPATCAYRILKVMLWNE